MIANILDAAVAFLLLLFSLVVYAVGSVLAVAGITTVVVLTLKAWGVL
jgi:hypothetical protein